MSAPRLAVVTGASSGIGRAFALALAAEGRPLILVARDAERLKELAGELTAEHGIEVECRGVDLADSGALRTLEQELEGREVAILVNAAGFLTVGAFEGLDREREDEAVRVMALAPMRLTHAVLSGMIARRCGLVVQVSSRAAFATTRELAVYSATKAFLNQLTLGLAERLSEVEGVHVHAVCPGNTRTEIFERAGVDTSAFPADRWSEPEAVAREALAAARKGEAISVTGEPRRDRFLRRCLPGGIWRRLAVVGRRLARV